MDSDALRAAGWPGAGGEEVARAGAPRGGGARAKGAALYFSAVCSGTDGTEALPPSRGRMGRGQAQKKWLLLAVHVAAAPGPKGSAVLRRASVPKEPVGSDAPFPFAWQDGRGQAEKKWLVLALHEAAAPGPKGSAVPGRAGVPKEPLGRVVLDLADFAAEDGRATRTLAVAFSSAAVKAAAGGVAKMLITIGCATGVA